MHATSRVQTTKMKREGRVPVALAMQNSMATPMLMQQQPPPPPQMGMMNPQMSPMFSNYNPLSSNKQQMPPNNMPPFMMNQQQLQHHHQYQQQQHLGFTSNHTGIMPQMGLPPQTQFNNMSNAPIFMNDRVNPCLPLQGQGFGGPNISNLPQLVNQTMGFPNLQNPMQNWNPCMPVQVPNPSQVGSFNIPMSSNLVWGQNSNFLVNGVFSAGNQVNPNQQNFGVPMSGVNAMMTLPVATQPAWGKQSHNMASPYVRRQVNLDQNGQNNTSSFNGKNFHKDSFRPQSKFVASESRYQRLQSHPINNRKRKFDFSKEHKGKGLGNQKAAKVDHSTPAAQVSKRKRSLAAFYTKKEVKMWREQRRKNWPTNANIQKKLNERAANSAIANREAETRCKELKEVLARQAELGFELPEIPRDYLSNSEKKVHGKSRLQNQNAKRGGNNKIHKLGKKRAQAKKESLDASSSIKREPTLLQKLLSKDIRKDKQRLLQVFRFMMLNSFFKDWPEKPLKFPVVEVDENWCDKEEEKSPMS